MAVVASLTSRWPSRPSGAVLQRARQRASSVGMNGVKTELACAAMAGEKRLTRPFDESRTRLPADALRDNIRAEDSCSDILCPPLAAPIESLAPASGNSGGKLRLHDGPRYAWDGV